MRDGDWGIRMAPSPQLAERVPTSRLCQAPRLASVRVWSHSPMLVSREPVAAKGTVGRAVRHHCRRRNPRSTACRSPGDGFPLPVLAQPLGGERVVAVRTVQDHVGGISVGGCESGAGARVRPWWAVLGGEQTGDASSVGSRCNGLAAAVEAGGSSCRGWPHGELPEARIGPSHCTSRGRRQLLDVMRPHMPEPGPMTADRGCTTPWRDHSGPAGPGRRLVVLDWRVLDWRVGTAARLPSFRPRWYRGNEDGHDNGRVAQVGGQVKNMPFSGGWQPSA